MDEEEDSDADLNKILRDYGLPPISPGGWDDPTDEGWEDGF